MNTAALRSYLGGLTREQLERLLAQLYVTAPDEFEIAQRTVDGGA